MRCRQRTKSGAPCKAAALRGKSVCVLHSDRVRQISSLGGRAARHKSHDLAALPPPKNAEQLFEVISAAITELRTGKLTARDAAALSTLVNAGQALVKTHRLEGLIDLIREADAQRERSER